MFIFRRLFSSTPVLIIAIGIAIIYWGLNDVSASVLFVSFPEQKVKIYPTSPKFIDLQPNFSGSINATGTFTTTLITDKSENLHVDNSPPLISADGYDVVLIVPANLVISTTISDYGFAVYNLEQHQFSPVSFTDNHNDYANTSAISANGRYVAFASNGTSFVVNDTNSYADVFVRDLETGTISRVSIASDGTESNGGSGYAGPPNRQRIAISADGRYVAFASEATNLVAGDTNEFLDVFVHDRETGVTSRVSVASDGEEGYRDSYSPSLSADGQYVAFVSEAFNFAESRPGVSPTLYVHDRETKQTTPVSVASDGSYAHKSFAPSLSADGRYVTFASAATNLVNAVPVEYLQKIQIYRHDRKTKETILISRAPDGTPGENNSGSPSISAHGRYVVFESFATNLISGEVVDGQARNHIYLYDSNTGRNSLISVTSDGIPITSWSRTPSISADGRTTAFASGSSVYVYQSENERDDNRCSAPPGDNDLDGLPNQWEICGYNVNGDKIIDLNLPEMGANPQRKDIFVEIDYMETITHSHKPMAGALEDVVAVFATKGISLHIMVDEAVPEIEPIVFSSDPVQATPAGTFDDLKLGNPINRCGTNANDGHFGTISDRLSDNCGHILDARHEVFRYTIFGHNHAHVMGSSGRAEIPGNDLIITVGGWSNLWIDRFGGKREVERSTFMHELGHTLGLDHGGIAGDKTNCKPNYLSVMNYSLQFRNFDSTRPLDYSHQLLAPLNENGGLAEVAGVGGPAGRQIVFGIGGVMSTTLANGAVNWNGTGSSSDTNVTADINYIAEIPGCARDGYKILVGNNDWEKLTFDFRSSPDFANGADRVTPSSIAEQTYEDVVRGAESFDFDGDGYSNARDTCPAHPNPDQTDTDGDSWGDVCDNCPTVPNSDENDGLNGDQVGAACKEQGGNIFLPLIVTS